MDINALLSPDSSSTRASTSASSSASTSPRKPRGPAAAAQAASGKRPTSGLSNELIRSPDREGPNATPPAVIDGVISPHPYSPLHPIPESVAGFRPLQQSMQNAPTSNPASSLDRPDLSRHSSAQSFTRPVATTRATSTPQMETLADLASMQQRHHTVRTISSDSLRHSSIVDSHISPSPLPPPVARHMSGQSLADLTMAEAPVSTPPPRNFSSEDLSDADSKAITDLLSFLAENSYAYDSHVQLIALLRKGFLAHVDLTGSGASAHIQGRSYGLLTELRQAREAMDTRFSVGESIWLDWLADESLLASSSEERIAVTEQFQKAVQDEPASVSLWQAYADWVLANYTASHDLGNSSDPRWTEEDKEVCRDLFTRDMYLNVLEQATVATQWRIDQSHVLWNRWIDGVQEAFSDPPQPTEIQRLQEAFIQRLQIPHAQSAETAQMFWPIVNRYEPDRWEGIMAHVNQLAEPARKEMAAREDYEHRLQRAVDTQDKAATFQELGAYLKWEGKRKKHEPHQVDLRNALYERALLHFPTQTEWWLEYVDYATVSKSSVAVLPLLERATRHCPWSGDLWAARILRSDIEHKPHFEIEATKHRATNSGLLDVGGMEELLKVLQQWCSYLRRHAFGDASTEDELDTAEVGITTALEDIQQAGQRLYGKDFAGDPLYRLESIQIKFLTEARRLNDAREIYRRLIPKQKDSYHFWAKFYNWELWWWGYARMQESHRVETTENGPHLATAVAQEALSQRNIDEPERVLDMYLNHFQQHESSEKLQSALIDAREYSRHLATRRAKEIEAAAAAAAAEAAEAAVLQPSALTEEAPTAAVGEKRKAVDDTDDTNNQKRLKSSDRPDLPAETDAPQPTTEAPKRDREHNSVTLRNLPIDVEDIEIKKFLRDVGNPVSINILRNDAKGSATATVEFESQEDVLAAKTRNGRPIRDRDVAISSGSQNTLYVSNYPAEFDEVAIRSLFDSYGEIVSVRFPSLKFNARRRFCYVQFATEEMARSAEAAMDDKSLDGQHRLLAKISDPDAKKQRSGAQAEGRELFVRNIDREVDESAVKDFFSQYGTVANMNLVKMVNGKRTGTGFIVFATSDEAGAALAANNKPLNNRILRVELATAKGGVAPLDRARKTDIIVKGAPSTSPDPDDANGRRGSDVSMASAAAGHEDTYKTAKERKVAIFNLPETVNDARIRAAMEKHGRLVKIQLRREKQGAIVEFDNIQDAFNVRQGVDCTTLGPDVKTGDVADLLAKPSKRKETVPPAPAASFGPAIVSRPAQRGGRRGGLGFKRGGFGAGASSIKTTAENGSESTTANGSADTAARSNADFRKMFEKGKGDGEA